MEEEQQPGFFRETQELVEDYLRNRLHLFRLQMAEKSAKLVTLLVTVLVVALLAFFVLLFISITAGYFFAQKTGSLFTGFGIVAVFYVLLLLVLLGLRKRYLDKYITNTVIRIFFEAMPEEDEEPAEDKIHHRN